MFHEIEEIEQEKDRVLRRRAPGEAPPVLCAFDVRTTGTTVEFGTRLRSVLAPALELAVSHPFNGEDLPVDTLPDWFVASDRERSASAPEFVRRGTERYVAALERWAWDLQEWLYQFDPESESRGWAWWDLTQTSDTSVRVWVDTWGESFFACNELRWAAYVCGAEEVRGPALVRSSDWVEAIQS
ncbi:hypothetical protein [Streptomyces sp. NPDC047028]|uniref:hypothetical protein n=1 Tax=Streptomyces sp. NPDC047028 TaxID=3155793 RepID=UPI00340E5374